MKSAQSKQRSSTHPPQIALRPDAMVCFEEGDLVKVVWSPATAFDDENTPLAFTAFVITFEFFERVGDHKHRVLDVRRVLVEHDGREVVAGNLPDLILELRRIAFGEDEERNWFYSERDGSFSPFNEIGMHLVEKEALRRGIPPFWRGDYGFFD